MVKNHKISLLQAVALVTGNIVGSGIFLLPTALAIYGQFSLYGWLISTVGAILIALTFGRLSRQLPYTGGPYIYTRHAFGDFFGFLVAWGYWICTWTGNAAIVVGFVSNLAAFFPALQNSAILATTLCIITVWLITWINLLGIREVAHFQLVTTILKLIPLLIIGTFGFFFFKLSNFRVEPSSIQLPNAFFQTAALTLWSFLGIEAATIPAAEIKNPAKNVARATIIGTIISAVVFVMASTVVIGILPSSIMQKSTAPFADAAKLMGGNMLYYIIAATAAISSLGTLNGWILVQGQLPWAVANDGLFPKFFRQKNKNNVPANALILSSILVTILIFFNYSATLQTQFQNIILLSTLSTLIPYAFCSVAELVILKRKSHNFQWNKHKRLIFLSIATLIFTFAAIIGTGMKTIIYGLGLLMMGIPVYLWNKSLSKSTKN